jgi:hypothetical protein
MWESAPSWCRNDASTALSRSKCCWAIGPFPFDHASGTTEPSEMHAAAVVILLSGDRGPRARAARPGRTLA